MYKKIKILLRTEAQNDQIKIRCDRLYRKFQGKTCIIDDESYFTLNHNTINGNQIFYSSDINQTPACIKYKAKAKFEQKLLVWIAISEKGL